MELLDECSHSSGSRKSEDWDTASDEDWGSVSDIDSLPSIDSIEHALSNHHVRSDRALIEEVERMDHCLEEARGTKHYAPTADAHIADSSKTGMVKISPNHSPPQAQPEIQTLAGASFPPPETPCAEGFLVGYPTVRVMADSAPSWGTDNTPYVFSIADIKPVKSTILVENEVSWWLQRARCALIRRKEVCRKKKARHKSNLKKKLTC